jgi:hypothetical protein
LFSFTGHSDIEVGNQFIITHPNSVLINVLTGQYEALTDAHGGAGTATPPSLGRHMILTTDEIQQNDVVPVIAILFLVSLLLAHTEKLLLAFSFSYLKNLSYLSFLHLNFKRNYLHTTPQCPTRASS